MISGLYYVFFVLIFVIAVTLVFAILDFKKSRAGVALGIAAKISFICCFSISILNFNWVNFLFELLLSQTNAQLAHQVQPQGSPALIFVLAVVAMFLVGRVGNRALTNFAGGYFVSDDNAGIDPEDVRLSNVFDLLRVKILLWLSGTADRPLTYRGKNPFEVQDPADAPSWQELALDLVVTENSDYRKESSTWSDTHKVWMIKRLNHVRGTSEDAIVVPWPEEPPSKEIAEQLAQSLVSQHSTLSSIVIVSDAGESEFDKRLALQSGLELRLVSKVSLITSSLDFREYCNRLSARYSLEKQVFFGADDEGADPLTLAETYVPVSVRELDERDSLGPFEFERTLREWLKDESRVQYALLGEFGQGKSSAILNWAAGWAERFLREETSLKDERVPLVIELRGRSPMHNVSPEELLGEWGSRFGLSGDKLYNLVKAKKAVLVFEGFDEVKNVGSKLDRYRHFNSLWHFAFDGSKILFTGRPNFFFGTDEAKEILRNEQSRVSANKPSARVYSLCFLEPPEVQESLRMWPPNIRNAILKFADDDPEFRNIAKRPSMLPVIASSWRLITRQKATKSLSSADIIQNYIETSFLRKEGEGGTPTYQSVHWKARLFLTRLAALKMLTVGGRNTIRAVEIDEMVERVLPKLDAVFQGETADQQIAESWNTFKTHYDPNLNEDSSPRDMVRALAQDVRANGILAPDPAGGVDSFYFPHKQFYEYLLAYSYLELSTKGNLAHKDAFHSVGSIPRLETALTKEPQILPHLANLMPEDFVSQRERFPSLTREKNFFARVMRTQEYLFLDLHRIYSYLPSIVFPFDASKIEFTAWPGDGDVPLIRYKKGGKSVFKRNPFVLSFNPSANIDPIRLAGVAVAAGITIGALVSGINLLEPVFELIPQMRFFFETFNSWILFPIMLVFLAVSSFIVFAMYWNLIFRRVITAPYYLRLPWYIICRTRLSLEDVRTLFPNQTERLYLEQLYRNSRLTGV